MQVHTQAGFPSLLQWSEEQGHPSFALACMPIESNASRPMQAGPGECVHSNARSWPRET